MEVAPFAGPYKIQKKHPEGLQTQMVHNRPDLRCRGDERNRDTRMCPNVVTRSPPQVRRLTLPGTYPRDRGKVCAGRTTSPAVTRPLPRGAEHERRDNGSNEKYRRQRTVVTVRRHDVQMGLDGSNGKVERERAYVRVTREQRDG